MEQQMTDTPSLKTKAKASIIGLAKDVLWVGGFLLLFHSFAYGTYYIPSSSMEPTLLVGDRIAVSKFSLGYSRYSFPFSPPIFEGRVLGDRPERGDITVFAVPEQDNEVFIKRVIGLPGDRIQMKAGRLFINGELVPRVFQEEVVQVNGSGWPVRTRFYEETLPGGVTHRIAEFRDDGVNDNTPEFLVPDGHYFMMGDNRDNSNDSRARGGFGMVSYEELIGPAQIISVSFTSCQELNGEGCFLGLPFGRFFTVLK